MNGRQVKVKVKVFRFVSVLGPVARDAPRCLQPKLNLKVHRIHSSTYKYL